MVLSEIDISLLGNIASIVGLIISIGGILRVFYLKNIKKNIEVNFPIDVKSNESDKELDGALTIERLKSLILFTSNSQKHYSENSFKIRLLGVLFIVSLLGFIDNLLIYKVAVILVIFSSVMLSVVTTYLMKIRLRKDFLKEVVGGAYFSDKQILYLSQNTDSISTIPFVDQKMLAEISESLKSYANKI